MLLIGFPLKQEISIPSAVCLAHAAPAATGEQGHRASKGLQATNCKMASLTRTASKILWGWGRDTK